MKLNKLNILTAIILLLFGVNLYASTIQSTSKAAEGSLKSILQYALHEDPKVLEAKANLASAEAQTKVAKAGHYPSLSIVNTQVLTQKDKNSEHRKFNPTLRGQLNLYSWGLVESEIEYSKHKEAFFKHKEEETREQVGKTIIEYYLMALRAKEMITAHQDSLKRHEKILQKIETMASHDVGRAFEISEAESRLLQVESSIEEQSRILDIALSRLNRFSNKPITAQDIQDPFKNDTNVFIKQYKNEELYKSNPTFLAQKNELDSVKANLKASKAKLLPAINLQGDLYRGGYQVYLDVSWKIVDLASYHTVDQYRYTENAAQAKLQEILLELQEQARSSEIDMRKNNDRLAVIKKQINTQKQVVSSVELQFDIAKRSLLDVLNSYRELSSIQIAEIDIKNDYRLASMSYLVSQAKVAKWAGIENIHLKF
ncbi:TolC family protein [Haemophilus haemoglobinophilus]|nr:TolC family protein [Canicola haemoglobinophilus]